MNILLLVPDGVSVRNFVMTGLPAAFGREDSVDALVANGLATSLEVASGGFRFVEELGTYPERLVEAPIRRTLEYAHLRWCNTTGARFNLSSPIPGRGRSRLMRGTARAISVQAASHDRVLALVAVHDALADRRAEVARFVNLLDEWGIDIVVCAHQRPIAIQPVVMAARRLGIPTATFIFSWDNLTTKGRIAAPFDHYFVWSDRMQQELLHFYPDIDPDRVWVVGTPQFDPYADDTLVWSRSRFLEELGLEPGRPVICYSGGDTGTCPDDAEHLALLCRLIEEGAILGSPQVVLRPSPVDTSDRYDAALRRYPVALSRPAWIDHGGGWQAVAPTRDDLALLVNLTRHADLNINMASTMTLDFAIHDTPVVNLGFDMSDRHELARHYYSFEHYMPVLQFGAARVASDAAELASAVNDYLADPSLDREGRRAFVDFELPIRPGQSVPALVSAVRSIAAPRRVTARRAGD